MAKGDIISVALLDGAGIKHNVKTTISAGRPAVQIKCPREGEEIAQPSYTFQLAAKPGTEGVEVSIDQGEWLPCREALGLWWYDWSGFDKGEHELAARARRSDGIAPRSSTRLFSVS